MNGRVLYGRRLLDEVSLTGTIIRVGSEDWVIAGLYVAINPDLGLRLRVYSPASGAVSFLNQRDAEVLLGAAAPGDACPWSGKLYEEPGSPGWYGQFMDEQDDRDDLFERELELYRGFGSPLPEGLGVERLLRVEPGMEVVQYDVLLRSSADPNFDTLAERWARVERRPA